MKLAEKVAIVGGASRGIGKDIALAFAAAGAKVVVVARSEVEPDPRLPGTIYQTVAEIEAAGGHAIAVKADISDEEQVEAMVKRTLDPYGRVDILVNNAAVLVPRGIRLPTRHIDLQTESISRARFCASAPFYLVCSSNSKAGLLIFRHALPFFLAQAHIKTSPRHVPSCMRRPRLRWSA